MTGARYPRKFLKLLAVSTSAADFDIGRRGGNIAPVTLFIRRRHPQAEGPIRAWFAIAAKARWAGPAEIKKQFGGTVDFVGDNRVIFDLGGNKYRLVVHVSFEFSRILVKFIGTHAEYNRIHPETVSWRKK